MLKPKCFAFLCIVLLLLTGCVPKDDYDDYGYAEYPPLENVFAVTEFEEYDGDTETIAVFLTNDSDGRFPVSDNFRLQKKVDDGWRQIKIYYASKISLPMGRELSEHSEATICIDLKEHVKLPLLPGQYRIWIGSMNSDKTVSAEFTIK